MLKTCSICGRIHDFNQVCTRPCKKKTTRQNAFRDTYQWKQKRNQIKSRDKYLCQVCLTDKYKTNYRYTYDELEVHHIVPIEEDYNLRLLSTKVYWENPKERDDYKKYWDKYKKISALKEVDFVEYMKQKEILFIKNDMKKLNGTKVDYSKLIKYYRRKLVDYGVIKELKNEYKSEGKYIGKIRKEDRVVA